MALPVDEDEVRAIVGWGREHRVHLLAQGAVTGLVGASTPPPGGPPTLVVSTDLLTDPLEIRAADAVAVAGAGVRLSTLNDRAAAHGLELPVDLAADPALGAMVATNTGGSRVLRHGDMSAHVLGAQAVLADAEVSVVGDLRGLRKDNTGPDPHTCSWAPPGPSASSPPSPWHSRPCPRSGALRWSAPSPTPRRRRCWPRCAGSWATGSAPSRSCAPQRCAPVAPRSAACRWTPGPTPR